MSPAHYRLAGAADAPAVAAVHAASWRRHYRGAYADSFLDGDVDTDRLVVWRDRLRRPADESRTVVAEDDGEVVGFVHTLLDADPVWGALVDNLHVVGGRQQQGIGRRLMRHSASFVVEARPGSPLHLWVLAQNVAAQRFYTAVGGECVDTAAVPPVGGVEGRLDGEPLRRRYVWRDPGVLTLPAAGAALEG